MELFFIHNFWDFLDENKKESAGRDIWSHICLFLIIVGFCGLCGVVNWKQFWWEHHATETIVWSSLF